jgi:hypothetical protein
MNGLLLHRLSGHANDRSSENFTPIGQRTGEFCALDRALEPDRLLKEEIQHGAEGFQRCARRWRLTL